LFSAFDALVNRGFVIGYICAELGDCTCFEEMFEVGREIVFAMMSEDLGFEGIEVLNLQA
jgi:hypothetical protein